MSPLRSHPLYRATRAFLARAQGSPAAPPAPVPKPPTTGRSRAAVTAAAGSGFNGLSAGSATYRRVCRPFRPCPEAFPGAARNTGNNSGSSAAGSGGNLGHASAGGGWFVQPASVTNDGTGITISAATFGDTMQNSELDRYWKLWRGAGATEGKSGVQIDAAAAGAPTALLAYTGATFTDATTQVKLAQDPPSGVTAGVFARGTWSGTQFSGYAISSEGAVYRLWRYTNDARVSLGTAVNVPTANDLIAIRCTGTTIEILVNSVSRLSIIDATYASGTSGMCMNDADWTQLFSTFTIA